MCSNATFTIYYAEHYSPRPNGSCHLVKTMDSSVVETKRLLKSVWLSRVVLVQTVMAVYILKGKQIEM